TWDPRAALADRRMLERLLAAAANPRPGRLDQLGGLEIQVDSRAISGAEGFPAALRPSVAGPVDLGATAGLYRSRPLLIADALAGADGRRRTLEALACGCRVVSLPDSVLAAAAGESVRFVTASDDLAMALADTDGAGALDEAGIRPVSRRIFQGHAVPVALATLTGSLGLSVDPRARRSMSLLVRVVPDDPDRLIRSMKAQAFRPNEVVIAAAAGVPVRPEVVDALTRLAITTRTVSNDAGSWPALAAAASSAWLIAWPEAGFDDPNALLDLALAAEASRADAVGFVDGAVGFVGSAADHASGSFVADLPFAGTLLRPDLAAQVRAGEPLASAARRGARLFGTQAVLDRSDR
ncbi:MAG: hypothetical protein ACRDGQ_11875, partial [Candidatus Limnocylindrales bacterium]